MFNVVAEKQLSLTYLWDTNLVTGLCLLLFHKSGLRILSGDGTVLIESHQEFIQ